MQSSTVEIKGLDLVTGGSSSRLRPSLGAACLLHERYGLQNLGALIVDGNVAGIADIIATCSVEPITVEDVLAKLVTPPIGPTLDRLIEPLIALNYALAGIDPEGTAGKRKRDPETGKPIPWPEHHRRLFRIGTGWLGWTPEETWAATPIEIVEAYRGRVEMLCAMNGVEPPKEDDGREPDAEEVRDGIAKLKLLARTGKAR
jgi:hypothetical protein